MTAAWLVFDLFFYGTVLWLGLYLLTRDGANIVLRLAGVGTVAYAVAFALRTLALHAASASSIRGSSVWWLTLASFFLWLAALGYGFWGQPRLRAAYNTLTTLLLVGTVVLVGFGFGFLLLALPDTQWLFPGLGILFTFLGVTLARVDASAKGEALLPDIFRSFDYSLFTALFFGGQVALVMALATGVTFPMLALLLTTTATAILVQVFASPIQTAVERFAFARFPRLRQARAELRAAADALPRSELTLDLSTLDEAEFARLTRRALSHFGDLPRLASSPLIYLPAVEQRLRERGAPDNVLERAAELQSLLAESIAHLKPRTNGHFAPSDEWRHYNALYFPYVVGLKPYSLRADHDHLDPAAQAALEWFRASVPERTLYNWQTAASKLIAQHLRANGKDEG